MRTVRLAGFRVVIGPAWLAGTALLVVSLVATLPPLAAEPASGPTSVVAALIASAFVAALVVGLSIARAVVARRLGAPTADVRVLAMGSPPAPEPPPVSPRSEVLVAATAPVTGSFIGAILVGASSLAAGRDADAIAALQLALAWTGLGALAVAAFLALPLLPLDGGRLIRAVAWRVTGDLARATRLTTAVGRGFGYLVLGAGLVATFAGELLVGLWLLLLGWLATRVARGSADRARLEELTVGLMVRDATDEDPPTIGPALTLDALLDRAGQPDAGGVFPVVEGDRLAGVVFVDRISRRTRRRATELRVADVMVPLARLRPLRPADPLLDAVIRLEGGRIEALPVVSGDGPDRLVGLVTRERVLARLRARQALRPSGASQPGRAARG